MSEDRFDWDRTIVEPILRFDRTRIDWRLGLAAAVIVAVPVMVAVTTDLTNGAVVAALSAFNLLLGTGGLPTRRRWKAACLALIVNAVAISVGTFVAITGNFELLGIALAIAALSSVQLLPYGRWVAISGAVLFAIGLGLPGASPSVAALRLLVALAGGGWAFGVGSLFAWARHHPVPSPTPSAPPADRSPPRIPVRPVLLAAIAVGVAAAGAFALGNAIGLERNYWTVLTVVVVFQTGILAALSYASVRVVGTVLGAIVGGLITTAISGPAALTLTTAALAGGTFAVRSAGRSAYVVLLTPFVIVLVNIIFPSGWELASGRVLDTLLGSAVALVATGILWIGTAWERRERGRSRVSV